MSNVIKSTAVVDDRQRDQIQFPLRAPESVSCKVIKRDAQNAGVSFSQLPRLMPEKDGYQEQLNRIKVEVAEHQKELRSLVRQTENAREALAELEEKREALEKMKGLDFSEQAKQIVQEAEENAREIREQARRDCEGIAQEMSEQGYRDGFEQGAAQAREQVRDENAAGIQAIAQMLEELSGMREEMVRENESEIVNLVMAIAEKVIGRQLREEPDTVVDILRGVLEQNRRSEFIKIVISKDLLPVEATVSEEVKRRITDMGQQIDVFVDSGGKPGSLVVETPSGFTDLAVESQLGNIAETLQATLDDDTP